MLSEMEGQDDSDSDDERDEGGGYGT